MIRSWEKVDGRSWTVESCTLAVLCEFRTDVVRRVYSR